MSDIKVGESVGDSGVETKRKSYVAPSMQRLTLEQTQGKFLRHANTNDPEVRRMLECIAQIEKRNIS